MKATSFKFCEILELSDIYELHFSKLKQFINTFLHSFKPDLVKDILKGHFQHTKRTFCMLSFDFSLYFVKKFEPLKFKESFEFLYFAENISKTSQGNNFKNLR